MKKVKIYLNFSWAFASERQQEITAHSNTLTERGLLPDI